MYMSIPEKRMKTDVLIIGGGLAGCFAAMKAMEHGVKVTLVEKGHVAYTGSNATGIDHFPYCYIPEVHGRLGYKIEDFVKEHTQVASGIIDQELCEVMWQDSYERLLDLEKLGIKIRFEKIYSWNFGFEPGDYPDDPKFRIVPWWGFSVPSALNIEGRYIKWKLNDKLKELGVNVKHFYDTQELLVKNGSVIGAAGFNTRSGEFFVIEAKATVLAAGSLSRILPTPIMFNHLVPPNQCGEGQVMAFRAGAELAIMEQYPWLGRRIVVGAQRLKNWTRSSPATPSGYPAGRIVNVAGEIMPEQAGFDRALDKDLVNKQVEWVKKSIAEDKLPFYWDATWTGEEERKYAEWASGEEGLGIELWRHFKEDLKADLSTHQIELDNPRIVDPKQPVFFLITSPSGIVINTNTESTLSGLYAAGEVAYGQHFPSSPWAYVTGARAGNSAGQHALNTAQQEADRKQLDGIKEHYFAPLMVKEGHTWQETNLAINEITKSYILGLSPDRLKLGLGYLEELKNKKVQANNPHELMRTWETLSLLTVSEIFCRSALFPRKMTEWRILKNVDGEMEFSTRPIVYKYPIE